MLGGLGLRNHSSGSGETAPLIMDVYAISTSEIFSSFNFIRLWFLPPVPSKPWPLFGLVDLKENKQ